jgi:hypothetical protein
MKLYKTFAEWFKNRDDFYFSEQEETEACWEAATLAERNRCAEIVEKYAGCDKAVEEIRLSGGAA